MTRIVTGLERIVVQAFATALADGGVLVVGSGYITMHTKPHWATREARDDIVPFEKAVIAAAPKRRTAQWKAERRGRRP